jgi:hypothetical protein
VEFYLVKKYRNKLLYYARKYNVPPDDVFQEARIIEWQLQKSLPTNEVSYFLNSCRYRTLALANFGIVSFDELDLVKTLVDEDYYKWYEIYICELGEMLSQVDEILCDMFFMKVSFKVSWQAMKRAKFSAIPNNKYWNNVKYIKNIVTNYVHNPESLFLQLVEA